MRAPRLQLSHLVPDRGWRYAGLDRLDEAFEIPLRFLQVLLRPLALTGGAAARLARITPAGHEAVIHLTLTDDHPWAQAFVVIEALPVETLK